MSRIQEYLEAFARTGSYRAAAREVGVNKETLRRAVQDHEAKNGEMVLKRRSTLTNAEGEVVLQWNIEEKQDEDLRRALQIMIDEMAQKVVPLRPIDRAPRYSSKDLLTVYPVGDPHFGLRTHLEESGEDFDTEKAEADLIAAFDQMISVTPNTEEALLLILGDLFHADDETARTKRSGNALDVSDRHSIVTRIVFRALLHVIRRLLTHHQKVEVWLNRGNHDDQSAYAMSLLLDAFFAKEPRVTVCTNPGYFKYKRWGNNLFGSTHGHTAKMPDLPLIMATDRKADWGETEHHVWFVGHIHHKTKERIGADVESFNTLVPPDSWHHGEGYRSKRNMEAIVYHRRYGECQRFKADITLIREKAAA